MDASTDATSSHPACVPNIKKMFPVASDMPDRVTRNKIFRDALNNDALCIGRKREVRKIKLNEATRKLTSGQYTTPSEI